MCELFKMQYLYYSEAYNVKLHCKPKLWRDGHNLDVIRADVNMCSENI